MNNVRNPGSFKVRASHVNTVIAEVKPSLKPGRIAENNSIG